MELRSLTTTQYYDAQVAIVGSMLIDSRCIGPVLNLVSEDDFSIQSLRDIFHCIHSLFDNSSPVDAVIVNKRLGGEYTETIADCMKATPTAANAEEYCRLLKDESDLDRLKAMAEHILSARSADEAREIYTNSLMLAAKGNRWRRMEIRDALNALLDRLADPAPPKFIRWGLPVLDNNLQVKSNHGKFIVIGAESSVGKTAFALQLAFAMAATGRRVGFYSLETDEETAFDRVFVQRAKIKLRELQRKNVADQEYKRLTEFGDSLYKKPEIHMEIIECAGATSAEIRTDILINRFDAVFVDYVQLMHEKGEQRSTIVTNISMELHTIAQELGVILVGLSQLTPPQGVKYDPYRLNRKEDLRESKQLINDGDVIMIMSRTNQEDPNFRELVIDKNKDGPTGTVEMDFHPEYMSFEPHVHSKSEQYRNVLKASAAAKKEQKGQVTFENMGDDEGGELPF